MMHHLMGGEVLRKGAVDAIQKSIINTGSRTDF